MVDESEIFKIIQSKSCSFAIGADDNNLEQIVSELSTVESTWIIEADKLSDTSKVESILEVHFIDVGQGDATLLKCNGHNMLIDAGDNTKGTAVQLYLNKQDIDHLDAVIWTHPDADHIGGADVITTKFDIEATYMSAVTADTKTYRDLMDAIKYKGYSPIVPDSGDHFSLGDATVTVLGTNGTYLDDNSNSIVCIVQFGETRFLFTGDAEEEEEDECPGLL